MSVDIDILTLLAEREGYEKYRGTISKGMVTKEAWTLINSYGNYYRDYPAKERIDPDFALWFQVSEYPGWKPEKHDVFKSINSRVQENETPDWSVIRDQLDSLRFYEALTEQRGLLQAGDTTADSVVSILSRYTESESGNEDTFFRATLDDLSSEQRSDDGFYWRCEDLNRSIGPIRRGDFVIIAKRPEVGGTSFLSSEMSFMLEQMGEDGHAILFNNEEAPDKVHTRMVSGALGVDYRTLMSNPAMYQREYEEWLGEREYDLVHNTTMDVGSVRSVLKGTGAGLIGINVLLKVGGTPAKEDHDKFQQLGEEFRRIAQEYGPVLAVVQADPSAEGMRYIPQDRIYKSKTALQGEADVLIMIGKEDESPADSRFLHVAKNKIPPAPCCDLSVKHIKSEVSFDLGTGRFETKTFDKHSRSGK